MARRMTTRSSPDVEPVHILSVTQALRNARTLFEEHNSSFVEQRSSPQNEVAEDDLERTVTIPNKDDLDRDTNNRTTEDQLDNYSCPSCLIYVSEGIECSSCLKWYHQSCASLTDRIYEQLSNSNDPWNCQLCNSPLPDLLFGQLNGHQEISDRLDKTYCEIVSWQKNLFMLPRGKAARDFLTELTRLINLFTFDTKWKPLALKFVHVFIPIMLQKPSPRSKAANNAKYLKDRLQMWEKGEIDKLMSQCREIQNNLKKSKNQTADQRYKAFCRFMFEGKVAKAMRFIDHDEESANGALACTPEVLEKLKEKHPHSRKTHPSALLSITSPAPESVIFEEIDTELIMKSARSVSGAGGPTQIDADIWKHLICSKFNKKQSEELASSIAELAKILCINNVPASHTSELLAGRLIPLDKRGGGIRPIGIGEVLRRIIAKSVASVLRCNIQRAAGTLQTCSGIESGIEGAIHAMRETFELETSEGMLLVDATNAFNNLNREAALNNVRQVCPSFSQFLNNCYQSKTRLFISGSKEFIWSEEGATQGDPVAMDMYAVATSPLVNSLASTLDSSTRQAWFADDSAACGRLQTIKVWWEKICELGPAFGYYPNASKTVLIVKGLENLPCANSLFSQTGIKITTEGERHLGAVIGSEEFKINYINAKVQGWVEDVKELANIAEEEPQIAYCAYTKGLCHRWKYFQRTVPHIATLFQPLENVIREVLIPKIFGREISDQERALFSLPLRYGGMGIQNPVEISDSEFAASAAVTRSLTDLILQQKSDLNLLDRSEMARVKNSLLQKRNECFKEHYDDLKSKETDPKFLELAREKGSYSWLSALPLKRLGYVLNKQSFRDAVRLRYNWKIPNVPRQCSCGVQNDNDHLLICKKGGYVHIRHDALVQVEADIMKEARCKDVVTEQHLIPTKGDHLRARTEKGDQSRMDIAATGVFSPMERTFFDVRVTHPNAPSNRSIPLNKLYVKHETEKKVKYEDRIVQVEKGSFCPLVFSTSGGVGPLCDTLHKRLASIIAHKRKEKYGDVIRFIRTRLRFALLKCVLMGLRGIRGKNTSQNEEQLADISFGLIPQIPFYEA